MNRYTTYGVHNVTPYEKFHGKKSDLSHAKIFVSIAVVHIPDEMRQKLDPKLREMYPSGVPYQLSYIYYDGGRFPYSNGDQPRLVPTSN